MEFVNLICPNSTSIWGGRAHVFSECFNDMVLGFGVNLITILVIIACFLSTHRNRTTSTLLYYSSHKTLTFSYIILPSLGACLSLYGILLLAFHHHHVPVPYHHWFFLSSHFFVWAIIMLSRRHHYWILLLSNPLFSFWWIARPLLAMAHLFSSKQAINLSKESFSILVDAVFGVFVNVVRVTHRSTENRNYGLADPLFACEADCEEFLQRDINGSAFSYWDVITFKAISLVMDRGSQKQLDFDDLILLPAQLDSSSCYNKLLNSWVLEQSRSYSHPSLFRAICYAYGWPYFCIGLLKCLCLSSAERSVFSEGEIQTFMSVDAERTINLCNSLHDVWSLPLQIGVALYLLYTQVKFAFISGITITILLIPVNRWLSILIARATEEMMKHKDERIKRAGDILMYIRTLKMYGWEALFADRLRETRALEVKYLSTRKYMDAWCVFFWATTPTLFSLFTFGLYTMTGHTLNAATVFTCLALFNTLISPLNSFPWVINGLIDATISTRRLSTFLSIPEHICDWLQKADPSSLSPPFCTDPGSQQMAVVLRDVSSVWSSSNKEQSSVLHQINLDLPKGLLITVIGEVGSGKSSLLNTIIGEMRLIRGSICLHGSLAYVPQVSWIQSGTIRDNVLLGKNYDTERYREVLKACALDVDISLMFGGDLAYIGEKEINLSGGQKARIALARAVYTGADVFLLDDVLSAVDAQVARWILFKAINGPLMNQHTRILCTHNPQAIASADMIVVMDKGHVKWSGLLAEFLAFSYSIIPSFEEPLGSSSQHLKKGCDNNASSNFEENLDLNRDLDVSKEAQLLETEKRKEGKVELNVYKNYAKFLSWPITVVICLSAVLMQASRNGNDLWLSFWVDATAQNHSVEYSTSFYLIILCIFSVVNSLLTLVRAFSFAFGGLRAAVQVHSELITKLINAPVFFFDQTPSGRILNRLSSDLYTIDDALPFILNILVANFVGLVGLVIVLSYVQVVFLLLLLPFWYIYSKLQLYYRSTSRELRRLDSVSRSPIYASFTETLDGSSTIRAFKAKEYFLARFTEHVALYQRTSYSEILASLWLSLRLQLLASFVISFIAVMAVTGCREDFPITFSTPGLVGLALSYAAPFVSLLSSYLATFTETEKEMVSVERLLQYMDVPQEELQGSISIHPNWPFHGQIEFHHVSLHYMPELPAALSDISFTVEGGTQVGIIGRTGAGKSSVLNALFRLSPICEGRILVDGVNVANVSVRDLREHFAVVPQSPFLFEGSIRDNLDPYQRIDESTIWGILDKCNVKHLVEGAGGLEILIKEGGMSFSVGQRQLLCLARALLKSSKVLCLDECTANVDSQTASILHNAISNKCEGVTVITIAHRISTVMDMDKILILDQGILVEEGNPQHLVQDVSSRFASFAKASVM